MNKLPETSLRIYDVTFSSIIFNRISLSLAFHHSVNGNNRSEPNGGVPDQISAPN